MALIGQGLMLLMDSFTGDQTFRWGGDTWRYLPVHTEQVTGWLGKVRVCVSGS